MSSACVKHSLSVLLAILLPLILYFGLATVPVRSTFAYDSYEPGGSDIGCFDCHDGFAGRGPLHDLHVGNSQMTSNCDLCHVQTGDNPKTWTSGDPAGQGCRGCHGVNNGTEFGWGAGLRAHHAAAGAPSDGNGDVCADCHNDPAPSPENTLPVYYSRADVEVNSPCAVTGTGSEDWDGNGRGLDNDGDLDYDGDDSDCSIVPAAPRTWGVIKALYR